jgi:hypothetical protein
MYGATVTDLSALLQIQDSFHQESFGVGFMTK